MCHWNEMYWKTYLSGQTNTQTVISLKNVGPRQVFEQNGIDITWNNDLIVKLVNRQALYFLWKWHNTVIPPTNICCQTILMTPPQARNIQNPCHGHIKIFKLGANGLAIFRVHLREMLRLWFTGPSNTLPN